MPVGFRTGRHDDPNRANWDDNGPRPLSWSAWYPTAAQAAATDFRFGPKEPWFDIGPVVHDAPIASDVPCPIVLLSHGTGGQALHLGWLAHRLAQHGFIALGIDHHGNTSIEPYRAEGFLCWWERTRDLSALLDHVLADTFGAHIDVSRIHVAGYSLGGCTAAALVGAITKTSRFQHTAASRDYVRGVPEFPDLADHLPRLLETNGTFRDSWARMSIDYRDPRFKSALMLAPGRGLLGFNEASLSRITATTQIIVGDIDPTRTASQWLHERIGGNKLDVLQSDVGHYVFLPKATEAGRKANPTACLDADHVDREAIHRHIVASAIKMFDRADIEEIKSCGGKSSGYEPLLAYSQGILSRSDAIRMLGLRDYTELLSSLGDANLPMPSASPHDADNQAAAFAKLWRRP